MNKTEELKVSEKLYNLNRSLSILIARKENLNSIEIEGLNLKLGEIIKEVRELEKQLKQGARR